LAAASPDPEDAQDVTVSDSPLSSKQRTDLSGDRNTTIQ